MPFTKYYVSFIPTAHFPILQYNIRMMCLERWHTGKHHLDEHTYHLMWCIIPMFAWIPECTPVLCFCYHMLLLITFKKSFHVPSAWRKTPTMHKWVFSTMMCIRITACVWNCNIVIPLNPHATLIIQPKLELCDWGQAKTSPCNMPELVKPDLSRSHKGTAPTSCELPTITLHNLKLTN